MSKELYINGVRADMDDKTDVNISYKSPLFSDLQAMAANTTLTIKLPKTAHNRALVESVISAGVESEWAYKYFRADIIEDGFEIIHNGTGYIITASETIELSIIFGGIASFAAIKDAKLPAMPINIDEGLILWGTPWVEFGQVSDIMFLRADFGQLRTHPDEMKYAHPCVKVTKIIEWINQAYGLKIDPTIGERLAVPCVTKNGRVNGRYNNPTYKTIPYGSGAMISGSDTRHWPASFSNPGSSYDIFIPLTDVYKIKFLDDGQVTFTGAYTCSTDDQGGAMMRAQNCVIQVTEHMPDGSMTEHLLEEQHTINVNTESTYMVWVVFDPVHRGKYLRNMTWNITPGGDLMYGEKFDTLNNLPDIKVVDFIKAIMQIEGLFPILTQHGIGTVSVDDIYANIPRTIDWSGKLLSHKSTSFRFSSFGQVNLLKWTQDDTVSPSAAADGVLYVDNKTIEASHDCVKLPFATCDVGLASMASIPLYIDKAKKGEAEQIEFQTIKARIVDINAMPGGHPHAGAMSMSAIVEQKYESYQKVIRRPRVEKCIFRLSPRDVAQIDMTIPIYVEQLGAHYAIINLMVKENETEAELLQL